MFRASPVRVQASLAGLPDGTRLYLPGSQNRYGEQWVFVFDYTAGQGYLRGGDAGWDQVFMLPGDGTLPTDQLPVLNEEERRWLEACVQAAVQRKPG